MEYNFYLDKCGDDDVISFKDAIYKVGKFRNVINYAFTDPHKVKNELNRGLNERKVQISTTELWDEGLDCEVLKLGATAWQKGKMKNRVIVEFDPDEPENSQLESPLDDIRRQIVNQDS